MAANPLFPTGGGGWRAGVRNRLPNATTRAQPGTATLESFLRRQPATPPAQQQAATADQVNTYLASLGLPPVPPGVDPMAAMVMAMQSAMYAPPPPDPWAAGAFYDPWAAYYAPSPDMPLDQWQAETIYAAQPSAWSSAYGGGG